MEFWCHQCHAIVRIVTHENSSVSCVQCQGSFVELMDANNEDAPQNFVPDDENADENAEDGTEQNEEQHQNLNQGLASLLAQAFQQVANTNTEANEGDNEGGNEESHAPPSFRRVVNMSVGTRRSLRTNRQSQRETSGVRRRSQTNDQAAQEGNTETTTNTEDNEGEDDEISTPPGYRRIVIGQGQNITGTNNDAFTGFLENIVRQMSAHSGSGEHQVEVFMTPATLTAEGNTAAIAQMMQAAMGGSGGGSMQLGDYAFGNISAVLNRLMAQSGENGTPPASTASVAGLSRVKLTSKELESNSDCAVCKDDFTLEGEVIRLPCSHPFHSPCILPWLEQHNSCPICRFELPTDDADYERNRAQNTVPSSTTTPSLQEDVD